jgi:methionyl-tRNA synthetase
VSVARRPFYLTTPIYYINAPPHLGHAYTTIIADAMARYRRQQGDDVWLLTGTDEHGDKIAQAAARAGVAPQALADQNSAAFRDAWARLGITNDDFIRTTEARHRAVVQDILKRLWDRGEIYLGNYGGHYCFGCERFYTDKEIVDGRCPDHQIPLTWIEESNYFFRMSKYRDWLVEHVEGHPDFIRPERYRNEILGFLRDPLQDLSISRPRTRLEWGIPIPFDDTFVTYVWFDALINYVSALGGPGDPRFEKYWPHAQHLIGKDILKPHAVYWPCMLAALADALGRPRATLLPRHLDVHGYWNIGGGKMSKSVGNVVEALALGDRYGHDAFRYFVMREMVFGLDADFSEEAFVGRLNADLANDLGNLVSRATTMLITFGGGRVPEAAAAAATPAETSLPRLIDDVRRTVEREMETFAFSGALTAIWQLVRALNGYVDTTAPWRLAKDPAQRERLDTVLRVLADSLRALAELLAPFLPGAARRMSDALTSTPVAKLSDLFPRVDLAGTAPAAAGATADRSAPADPTPALTIDEFARLDLRVAEVVAAEAVPKSRKLLKLTVSLGEERRTVVAGIAEHYAPAALVGKRVVVVANLAPAKLMGVQSHGMVLAGSVEGALALLTVDRELPPGAKVR